MSGKGLWLTNREKREKRERVLWFRGTVLLNHFNGGITVFEARFARDSPQQETTAVS